MFEQSATVPHEGRTIVFVTHGVDLVRQICDRAYVLDHGLQVIEGVPGEAIRVFREYLLKKGVAAGEADQVAPEIQLTHGEAQVAKATKAVKITGARLTGNNAERTYILPGESLDIEIDYQATGVVDDVVFGIAVHDVEGRVVFGWNTTMLGVDIAPLIDSGTINFHFPQIPLLDGDYDVTIGAHTRDEGVVYDWHDQQYHFEVMNPGKGAGIVWAPAEVTKHEHTRKDATA